MISVFPNLDMEMEKRNMHYRDLAKVAGVNELQMYRRLRGISKFQLSEAAKICWHFDCPDVNRLFARR
jgi:DNA-binding Xre family transcriptional regulator